MNIPTIRPDILTCGGSYFNFLNPHENEFRIEDIAHALSNVCRFAGHTREFYSVAQHSVLVSRITARLAPHPKNILDWGRAGLLHDAAEAYIGDITQPLKQLLPDYKVIEKNVEDALFKAFGLDFPFPDEVKQADMILLATEKRDLMPPHEDEWLLIKGVTPMAEIINPWGPAKAEREFLMMWEELGGVMG